MAQCRRLPSPAAGLWAAPRRARACIVVLDPSATPPELLSSGGRLADDLTGALAQVFARGQRRAQARLRHRLSARQSARDPRLSARHPRKARLGSGCASRVGHVWGYAAGYPGRLSVPRRAPRPPTHAWNVRARARVRALVRMLALLCLLPLLVSLAVALLVSLALYSPLNAGIVRERGVGRHLRVTPVVNLRSGYQKPCAAAVTCRFSSEANGGD